MYERGEIKQNQTTRLMEVKLVTAKDLEHPHTFYYIDGPPVFQFAQKAIYPRAPPPPQFPGGLPGGPPAALPLQHMAVTIPRTISQ